MARGRWQYAIWTSLMAGEAVTNPVSSLRGRAKTYAGRYEQSFRSLLARMAAAGYPVVVEHGVHGGKWSATYRLQQAGE